MKVITFLLFTFISFSSINSGIDLESIRQNFPKAVSDKKICQSMISDLSSQTPSNIHLAYLGAYQTIWANHTINPFKKLSTFSKGKNNIDKAVKLSSNDIEIRFIRLSVQKNCPDFLGYNNNIKEDEKFIKEHINNNTSPTLKKMIEQLLKK